MMFPPTIEQVRANPAYSTAIWDLVATQSGILRCGVTRGPRAHTDHILIKQLIAGLGIVKSDFQNQTLYFGHKYSQKYSLLLVDNRGLGGSAQVPLHRTSTHHMALDILEIADHLGWTAFRQLHVAGGSMGGMIAQELVFAAPERVASLSLWSTAARYENVGHGVRGLWDGLRNAVNMIIPKTLQAEMKHIANIAYPEEWLRAEDDIELPNEDAVKYRMPRLKHGERKDEEGSRYLRFPNNYERFVAMELGKRERLGGYTTAGFLMQAAAATFHCKTAEQLEVMANKVGRERIMIVHGVADVAMPFTLGERLMEMVRPGRKIIVEGMGHAPIHERARWFNDLLVGHFDSVGEMDER